MLKEPKIIMNCKQYVSKNVWLYYHWLPYSITGWYVPCSIFNSWWKTESAVTRSSSKAYIIVLVTQMRNWKIWKLVDFIISILKYRYHFGYLFKGRIAPLPDEHCCMRCPQILGEKTSSQNSQGIALWIQWHFFIKIRWH